MSGAKRQIRHLSAILCREQVTFNEMMVMKRFCVFLDHWNNSLRVDMCANSLIQQSMGWLVTTRTHYSDSKPTSLCFLMLLPEKQQIPIFDSLWFDPIGARTHDIRTRDDHCGLLKRTLCSPGKGNCYKAQTYKCCTRCFI